MATRPDEQVRDLLLLGLTWVSESASTWRLAGWAGHGILNTIYMCGGIDRAQYRILAANPPQSLRACTLKKTELVWPQADNQKRRGAAELAETSEKWLIALINTRLFFSDKLIVSHGYKLLPTDLGRAHAHEIANQYARDLSHDKFWGQWVNHARQMRGLYAHKPDH